VVRGLPRVARDHEARIAEVLGAPALGNASPWTYPTEVLTGDGGSLGQQAELIFVGLSEDDDEEEWVDEEDEEEWVEEQDDVLASES
jgi:hypothetical protein